MAVSISEDATAIVSRRQFDPKTNSVTGCSLPLQKRGLPEAKDAVVDNAIDIIKMFENHEKATVIMVVMAQPLADGFPPIRIASFGTDNRFTFQDVKNRISNIIKELKNHGVEVVTYSADGDTRELKMMSQQLELGVLPKALKDRVLGNGSPWFVAKTLTSCKPIQDVIHERAKLRTRLLKSHLRLPFGNCVASVSDLFFLKNSVTKEKHLLRDGDMLLEDKMNYDAVLRLCRPELRELIAKHVPNSEGTCFYLKIMSNITSSYLDKNITPLERVYRIWHFVFALRYWRFWMNCDDVYNLSDCFISSNSYICAEVLAHSLVLLITKFREDKTPELLMPWLFTSQPCESFFKALRSLSPVGSSQTNFTVLEFLHIAAKVNKV